MAHSTDQMKHSSMQITLVKKAARSDDGKYENRAPSPMNFRVEGRAPKCGTGDVATQRLRLRENGIVGMEWNDEHKSVQQRPIPTQPSAPL